VFVCTETSRQREALQVARQSTYGKLGHLDDRFQNSNHTGSSENAAVLRTENNTQLIGFMDSRD
jgi:hypothetical protein